MCVREKGHGEARERGQPLSTHSATSGHPCHQDSLETIPGFAPCAFPCLHSLWEPGQGLPHHQPLPCRWWMGPKEMGPWLLLCKVTELLRRCLHKEQGRGSVQAAAREGTAACGMSSSQREPVTLLTGDLSGQRARERGEFGVSSRTPKAKSRAVPKVQKITPRWKPWLCFRCPRGQVIRHSWKEALKTEAHDPG